MNTQKMDTKINIQILLFCAIIQIHKIRRKKKKEDKYRNKRSGRCLLTYGRYPRPALQSLNRTEWFCNDNTVGKYSLLFAVQNYLYSGLCLPLRFADLNALSFFFMFDFLEGFG